MWRGGRMKKSILTVLLIFALASQAYAMGSMFGGGGGGSSAPAGANSSGGKSSGNNSGTAGGVAPSMSAGGGSGTGTNAGNNNTSGGGLMVTNMTLDPKGSECASVPEPSVMLLLASGGLVLGYARRKTRN